MKTLLLAGLALALAACGGSSPAVKSVTVARVTPPAPSATTVARPDAPARSRLVLAFEEKPIGDAGAVAFDGRELYVNLGGKLRVFAAGGPIAPRPSTWKPGDPLVVVGDDAFDPVAQTPHAPPMATSPSCLSHAFSYGGARMSVNCSDPSGTEVVYVYDTRTGARVGVFSEFQTAAPIRMGSITSSGNFVFWQSRATGGFEEIKSHVTGPEMSSHSVMSRDETMVFTTVDRNWYTDDRTAARVLDPKNGRTLFELGRDVDTAFFSPSSQLFAARHSKNWSDPEHSSEKDKTELTFHDRSGALLARVPGDDAVEAAFAPDDSGVAVRFASGAISVYTIRR